MVRVIEQGFESAWLDGNEPRRSCAGGCGKRPEAKLLYRNAEFAHLGLIHPNQVVVCLCDVSDETEYRTSQREKEKSALRC